MESKDLLQSHKELSEEYSVDFGLNLYLFVINFDGILFEKITIIQAGRCPNGTAWTLAVYICHHFLLTTTSLQSHQEFSEHYSVDFHF